MATGRLDTEELAGRLAPHLQPGATVRRLERLPAGLSGITCVAELDGADAERIVVKVAVAGVPPTKNRDVLRQARMIELLHGHGHGRVPVPRVLFTDAGAPPDVPPLYATEFVAGQSCEPLDDEEVTELPDPADLRRRYLHAATVLGTLHGTPVDGAVTSAGSGPASPADELDRWTRVFAAVPEDLRGAAERCGDLLRRGVPDAGPVVVLHGDYRLGNTLCRGGAVAAVIDWEIWGLGDARCDLAWLLHLSDPSSVTARRALAGVPSRAEMIAAYDAARGGAVGGMGWFDALALYKRAAATALIVKHNRRSPTPEARKERAAEVIDPLLDAAVQALTESE